MASSQRRYYPVHSNNSSASNLLAPNNYSSPNLASAPGNVRGQGLPSGPVPQPQYMRRQGPGAPPSIQTIPRSDSKRSSNGSHASHTSKMSDTYSLPPDPQEWGTMLTPTQAEPDDYLHNPRGVKDHSLYGRGTIFTSRGLLNIGCLIVLLACLLGLFVAFPVTQFFLKNSLSNLGGFNVGGLNASGQVPSMTGNIGLVDLETPKDVYTKKANTGKGNMRLIFSDEFNTDGRTFYPGDDPYWEAVDIHYAATNNMEWYDPMAVTTADGALEITLEKKETHDLHFQGGMITSWNKFCFTGGLIETAVILPGSNNVHGLWPAIWTMGNLGRAGYGATTEGTWPYSYDACDVGTAPNQTRNGLPLAALQNGDPKANDELSWLPGQRLSRCTCPGESHPGPMHSDGTFVGRSAPEIDILEAQIGDKGGTVSQSGQFAPFNAQYVWQNTSANLIIDDPTISELNGYVGSSLQQAVSVVSLTNQNCYDQGGTSCFAVYGIEYKPGFDEGYITWLNDGKKAWTLMGNGMQADPKVEISARPIPQEPMYIIANLGLSTAFGAVDLDHLIFPTKMKIDYIRVYQDEDNVNYGCDPKDFPTKAYIDQYIQAYNDFNFTTWEDDFKQPVPKNKFLGQC